MHFYIHMEKKNAEALLAVRKSFLNERLKKKQRKEKVSCTWPFSEKHEGEQKHFFNLGPCLIFKRRMSHPPRTGAFQMQPSIRYLLSATLGADGM